MKAEFYFDPDPKSWYHQLTRHGFTKGYETSVISPGPSYISFSGFFPFLLRISVDLIMGIRARLVAVDTRLIINVAVVAGPESQFATGVSRGETSAILALLYQGDKITVT